VWWRRTITKVEHQVKINKVDGREKAHVNQKMYGLSSQILQKTGHRYPAGSFFMKNGLAS